jgi:hypothetical protein
MINDQDQDQRLMKKTYTIENIINGLKYIDAEFDVNSASWKQFCVRIDVIDNAVDKLIETIEIRKKKANESTH